MYEPSETRYETMPYNRCGKSGLRLPALSVGLWQNFGVNNDYDTMKEIILTAFDHGVTHFDLANNYGPEPGGQRSTLAAYSRKICALTGIS